MSIPHIPVRRIARRSVLVWVLITLNIGIFAAQHYSHSDRLFWRDFGINHLIFHGYVWEPLTTMFIHLNWTHVLGNMATLALIGVVACWLTRPREVLAIYGVSGFAGALLTLLVAPPTSDTIGASGAIMGLAAATVVLLWVHHWPVWPYLAWLALALATSFSSGVSWTTHVGGMAGGLAAITVLLWRQKVRRRRVAARSHGQCV